MVPTEALSDGIPICDLVRDNVALTSSAVAVRTGDRSQRSSETIRSGLLGEIAQREGEGVQQGEIRWLSCGGRFNDIQIYSGSDTMVVSNFDGVHVNIASKYDIDLGSYLIHLRLGNLD